MARIPLPQTTIGIDSAMPKTHQLHVAVGRGGDGEHVVEAHDGVGDDDDPDGFAKRSALTDVSFGARLVTHELECDPEEQQAADELEERNPQQTASRSR